jgi:hypothetical protein
MTCIKKRNHLLGIFYYQTAEGRERRVRAAIEDALKVAKRTENGRKRSNL